MGVNKFPDSVLKAGCESQAAGSIILEKHACLT